MKKVILLAGCLLLSAGTAVAQDKYLELFRADLKAEKTAIVTENLQLTDDQATLFWPIYREYDLKLATLQDERLALLKDYAAGYDNLGPETAMTLMEKAFTLEEKRLKLRKQYFEKAAKAVSPIVAARFAHIESVIQHLVDLQVQMEIPMAVEPAAPGAGGK
jgi:hypothetical protein